MKILNYLIVRQQATIDVAKSVGILLPKLNRISFDRLLRSLDNGQEFVVSALALNSRLKHLSKTVCESDDLQERGSGRLKVIPF